MFYLFMALAAICGIAGNLLVKYSNTPSGLGQILCHPPFYAAVALWIVNALFFSKAVSYAHVSIAYSTLFVGTLVPMTLISVFIFKDPLTARQILGLILVIAGVITCSEVKTTAV